MNKIIADEIDVVRIVHLDDDIASRVDRGCSSRNPTVGDEGTVMTVLAKGEAYIVESVSAAGPTEWLADLRNHEIEVIQRYTE